MNRQLLEKIVDAVLYEGYILYPYRPSAVKNQRRWTFGGLYPESFHLVSEGAESCVMQTQCLVEGSEQTIANISVRFLHLVTRTIREFEEPPETLPADENPMSRAVDWLLVGGRVYQSWQEASECEVGVPPLTLGRLCRQPVTHPFAFSRGSETEALRREDGKIAGVLIRRRESVAGGVELSAERKSDGVFQISVRVVNRSTMPHPETDSRDVAQLYSLASTHVIINVEAGALVSAIDPPEQFRQLQAGCRNVGAWPVLVGQEPQRDTMLASPIILYDYPQIAPESQGNLFDSTEIDEILTLRIMTLTDDEKQAAAGADERVRHLLARTHALGRDQLASLHGTIRGLQTVNSGEASHE